MYGWHDSQNAAQSNVSCAANAVASEISIGINTMTWWKSLQTFVKF